MQKLNFASYAWSFKANETFDDIAYEVSKNIALQSTRIQVYYV